MVSFSGAKRTALKRFTKGKKTSFLPLSNLIHNVININHSPNYKVHTQCVKIALFNVAVLRKEIRSGEIRV